MYFMIKLWLKQTLLVKQIKEILFFSRIELILNLNKNETKITTISTVESACTSTPTNDVSGRINYLKGIYVQLR